MAWIAGALLGRRLRMLASPTATFLLKASPFSAGLLTFSEISGLYRAVSNIAGVDIFVN